MPDNNFYGLLFGKYMGQQICLEELILSWRNIVNINLDLYFNFISCLPLKRVQNSLLQPLINIIAIS